MSRWIRAGRIAVKAIVILAVTSFVLTGICTGTPSFFGYRLFFIMSESMEPTIMTHQFVVGKTLSEEEDIEIGDIVAYEKGEGLIRKTVIHRVIEKPDNGSYILKGNNNTNPDLPVDRGHILYRIVRADIAEYIEK